MSESNKNRGKATPRDGHPINAPKAQSAVRHGSASKPQHLFRPQSASKSESQLRNPQSASKNPRTPKQNSSVSTSNSSVFMSGVKKLEATDHLNSTTCLPTIKRLIITKPAVNQDLELEVKLTYNDYLQANFQKLLLEETLIKQKQDFKEQLFIQSEKNYKAEVELIKTQQQLEELLLLEQIGPTLQQILEAQDKFTEIYNSSNLDLHLRQLFTILKDMNCRIYTDNNVNSIKNEENYEELSLLMSNCASACKESKPLNFSEVNNLAVLIQSLQETVKKFKDAQNIFDSTHKEHTSKLLKALSDFYASREKY